MCVCGRGGACGKRMYKHQEVNQCCYIRGIEYSMHYSFNCSVDVKILKMLRGKR